MQIIRLVLLLGGTLGIIWVSRPALRVLSSHGFPRLIAWELILVLFTLNMDAWFADAWQPRQLLSWGLLAVSLLLILLGVRAFRRRGQVDVGRPDPALVGIEKTTQLVTSGVYGFIRHPFYSSLLFLAWGIFLKRPTWPGFVLGSAATLFLIWTAKREEKENLAYFGQPYLEYIQTTKMFVPFVF